MKVLMFSVCLLVSSAAVAQQPILRPLVRPLIGQGYATAPQPYAYPQNYSYPRQRAWARQDRLLDLYDFDAMSRRYDTMLKQGPGVTTFQDLTPQPWMYPWLYNK